jgi:hypothetical protein
MSNILIIISFLHLFFIIVEANCHTLIQTVLPLSHLRLCDFNPPHNPLSVHCSDASRISPSLKIILAIGINKVTSPSHVFLLPKLLLLYRGLLWVFSTGETLFTGKEGFLFSARKCKPLYSLHLCMLTNFSNVFIFLRVLFRMAFCCLLTLTMICFISTSASLLLLNLILIIFYMQWLFIFTKLPNSLPLCFILLLYFYQCNVTVLLF